MDKKNETEKITDIKDFKDFKHMIDIIPDPVMGIISAYRDSYALLKDGSVITFSLYDELLYLIHTHNINCEKKKETNPVKEIVFNSDIVIMTDYIIELYHNYLYDDVKSYSYSVYGDSNYTIFRILFPEIKIIRGDIILEGDCCSLFSKLTRLEYVNIKDISNIYSMKLMFSTCNSLKKVKIDNQDSKLLKNMYGMFFNCFALEDCGLENLYTSNVVEMGNVFKNCMVLNNNLNDWDVSNVLNMDFMFKNCINFSCSLRDWKCKNLISCNNMFYDCRQLSDKILDWSLSIALMRDIIPNVNFDEIKQYTPRLILIILSHLNMNDTNYEQHIYNDFILYLVIYNIRSYMKRDNEFVRLFKDVYSTHHNSLSLEYVYNHHRELMERYR
jgi:hypothetical protein